MLQQFTEFCLIMALTSILALFVVITILCPFWPMIAIIGATVGTVYVVYSLFWPLVLLPVFLFIVFKISGQV